MTFPDTCETPHASPDGRRPIRGPEQPGGRLSGRPLRQAQGRLLRHAQGRSWAPDRGPGRHRGLEQECLRQIMTIHDIVFPHPGLVLYRHFDRAQRAEKSTRCCTPGPRPALRHRRSAVQISPLHGPADHSGRNDDGGLGGTAAAGMTGGGRANTERRIMTFPDTSWHSRPSRLDSAPAFGETVCYETVTNRQDGTAERQGQETQRMTGREVVRAWGH